MSDTKPEHKAVKGTDHINANHDNMTSEPAWFTSFKTEIFGKLDGIEDRLQTQIHSIRFDVNNLQTNVEDLQHSVENMQADTADISKKTDQADKKITKLQDENINLHQKLSTLNTKVQAMESKFRRSNLKFFGIQETNKETWTDTENIIKNTLLNDLKLSRETIDHMRIERAYRPSDQHYQCYSQTHNRELCILQRQRSCLGKQTKPEEK